eukprot:jgi/Picsp_1/43/NSC_00043-R1_helicase associated domain protein
MKYRKEGIRAYFKPVSTSDADGSAQDARQNEENEDQRIPEMAKESISAQSVEDQAPSSQASHARIENIDCNQDVAMEGGYSRALEERDINCNPGSQDDSDLLRLVQNIAGHLIKTGNTTLQFLANPSQNISTSRHLDATWDSLLDLVFVQKNNFNLEEVGDDPEELDFMGKVDALLVLLKKGKFQYEASKHIAVEQMAEKYGSSDAWPQIEAQLKNGAREHSTDLTCSKSKSEGHRNRILEHIHNYECELRAEGDKDEEEKYESFDSIVCKATGLVEPMSKISGLSEQHITCMFAALVCDSALFKINREVAEQGAEWGKDCHVRFVHLLRHPLGYNSYAPDIWFDHLAALVSDELLSDACNLDNDCKSGVRSILQVCNASIKERVTTVVGLAKELLDARLMMGKSWPCMDGKIRRVHDVWISGYKAFPTLNDWNFAANASYNGERQTKIQWKYDPFKMFSWMEDNPTSDTELDEIRRILHKEMESDCKGVDIGLVLCDEESSASQDVSVILCQCKFRSNPSHRDPKQSAETLRLYTCELEKSIKEDLNITIPVQSYWITTSVESPVPFEKNTSAYCPSITDQAAIKSSQFQSLSQGPYGQIFGHKELFLTALEYSIVGGICKSQEGTALSFKPRGFQQEAIDAVVNGLDKAPLYKGQLIAPPAFGKTYVSLPVAEYFFVQDKIDLVLFVTPLQRLCADGYRSWSMYLSQGSHSSIQLDMAVCMDDSSAPGVYHRKPGKEIQDWLAQRTEERGKQKCAIFTTYDSLDCLKEQCSLMDKSRIFLIVDESHYSAGYLTRITKYNRVHSFPGQRRLFMTATPCVHPDNLRGEDTNGFEVFLDAETDGINDKDRVGKKKRGKASHKYDCKEFACQNDKRGVFGPCLYRASWKRCIDEGMLVGVKVHPLDSRGLQLSENEYEIFLQILTTVQDSTITQTLLGLDDPMITPEQLPDLQKLTCDDNGVVHVPQRLVSGPEEIKEKYRLEEEVTMSRRKLEEIKARLKTLDEEVKNQLLMVESEHPNKKAKMDKKNRTNQLEDDHLVHERRTGPRLSEKNNQENAIALRGAPEDQDVLLQNMLAEKRTVQASLRKHQHRIKSALEKQRNQIAKPNSLRLIDMLSNLIHQIASSPSEGPEKVSHLISYHNSVPRAMHAMGIFKMLVAGSMKEFARQKEWEKAARLAQIQIGCVSSYQKCRKQENEIQIFAGSKYGILFNVGIMKIGQNVPQVNSVAFVDPMRQSNQVAQSIGRAMRVYGCPGTDKLAHVFLPISGRVYRDDKQENSNDEDAHDSMSLGSVLDDQEIEDQTGDIVAPWYTPQQAAEQMVREYIQNLSEQEKERLRKKSVKDFKGYKTAMNVAKELSGYGIQDLQVLGYLYRADAAISLGHKDGNGILTAKFSCKTSRQKGSRRTFDIIDHEEGSNIDMDEESGHGNVISDVHHGRNLLLSFLSCATRLYGGYTHSWMLHYQDLKDYLANNHNQYPYADDPSGLGTWLSNQRTQYKNKDHGQLTKERIMLLESLQDWSWHPVKDAWPAMFQSLKIFISNSGSMAYPRPADQPLYNWVVLQRQKCEKGLLSPDKKKSLESLSGWTWNSRKDKWLSNFNDLRKYVSSKDSFPRKKDDSRLFSWIHNQRAQYKKPDHGQLTDERITLLNGLKGWSWTGSTFMNLSM